MKPSVSSSMRGSFTFGVPHPPKFGSQLAQIFELPKGSYQGMQGCTCFAYFWQTNLLAPRLQRSQHWRMLTRPKPHEVSFSRNFLLLVSMNRHMPYNNCRRSRWPFRIKSTATFGSARGFRSPRDAACLCALWLWMGPLAKRLLYLGRGLAC